MGVTGNGDPFAKRHSIGNQIHQHRQAVCHITGQIAAVSTGIGAKLLFIQVLQIVQGLLGCKSKQAVGISLQSSQVIEAGGFSDFSLRSIFLIVTFAP